MTPTTACPSCGQPIALPISFRTRPTHDRDGRLVVTVTMLPQSHRCPPKEAPK